MTDTAKIISPIDGSVYAERPVATDAAVEAAVSNARAAQAEWRHTTVAERSKYILAFLDALLAMNDEIVTELAWQMGRPTRFGGEKGGVEERTRAAVAMAEEALAPYYPPEKPGFRRYVARDPLGLVLVIAPWNYPYLTAVNTIVPALLSGNAVILKHATQTLLVGERFAEAFAKSGLPKGLFQNIVLSHAQTERLVGSGQIDHINFTGSVSGGRVIERAAAGTFASLGLELGGKDPAYVMADAKLDHAIENLVDGAFYNSGQCCCGIERIYVDERVYDDFVDGFADLTKKYVVGSPLDAADDPWADGARRLRRYGARAGRRGEAQGRDAAGQHAGRERPAGLALPRAGGAGRRQPPDGGDARGELRPGRRHHEGARRRRGRHPDERQPLRPDRLDLDHRHRSRRRPRQPDRDRHGLHEPLRLSRPAAGAGPASRTPAAASPCRNSASTR